MRVRLMIGFLTASCMAGAGYADGKSISEMLDDLNNRLTAVEAREEGLQEVLSQAYLATTVPCGDLQWGIWLEGDQTQGRFLLGAGAGYPLGDTGGEKTVRLTAAHIPAHQHGGVLNHEGDKAKWFNGPKDAHHLPTVDGTTSKDGGDGQAHNNMPPYLVVYLCQLQVAPD